MRWRMLEILVVVIVVISILVVVALLVGELLHLLRTCSELSWSTLITRAHRNYRELVKIKTDRLMVTYFD